MSAFISASFLRRSTVECSHLRHCDEELFPTMVSNLESEADAGIEYEGDQA
jgi:hypothetical protein